MITSRLFAAAAIVAFATTSFACAAPGAHADESPESAESDVTKRSMVGDFHVDSRTLDEAFAFDGAVTELSITKDANGCQFQALQATGGCNATKLCSETTILSNEHVKTISGSCTLGATSLTLETPSGDLAFTVKATSVKGKSGFVLTSKNGDALNKGGASAFFVRTSRDPGDALSRSYAGGPNELLTKDIDPKSTSLSPEVRAGLAKLIDELSESDDDITRDVDGTFAVYANPFDKTPVAYAVSSTHSGDHCGGFQVFAVDVDGNKISTELSDGDCGL